MADSSDEAPTKRFRGVSPPPTKRRRTTPSSSHLAETLPTRPITALSAGKLRIFTWNVNGVAPFLQTTITSFFKSPAKRDRETSSLRDCLKRWKWPHILCLQEAKIAPSDSRSKNALRQAVKAPAGSQEPSYEAHFSLPRDKFNARGFGGKVYGVCTIIRSDVSIRDSSETAEISTEPVDWDLEGRVLVTKLSSMKLAVVNVYAVNGTDNPYRNPKTGKEEGTRHDHKRAFHTRLRNMVEQFEQNDWSVAVAGDLNIARDAVDGFPGIRLGAAHVENRRDFERKFMSTLEEGGLGMVDSFRDLHGIERKYTYRSPGNVWGSSCDRVDLILLSLRSTDKQKMLVEADILDDKDERGPSDHLPSYVTLNTGPAEPKQDVDSP